MTESPVHVPEDVKRNFTSRAQLNTIRLAYRLRHLGLDSAEVDSLAAVRKKLDAGESLSTEQTRLLKMICERMVK